MNLEEMLKNELIRKIEPDKEGAKRILKIAERDLKAAKDNLFNENYDWAFAIAYNVMLQSSRALMYREGFIPSGSQAHKAIIKFIQWKLRNEVEKSMLLIFDKMRSKRHNIVYDETDIVTLNMANQAINTAEKFLKTIKPLIRI